MAEFTGFHELASDLEALAEAFREDYKRGLSADTGRIASTKGAIETGVKNGMYDVVLQSRERAREYVPNDDAGTIDDESGGWMNDTYRHRFYAESDLVAFHEFGTGTKAEHPRYPGTVNAVADDGHRGYLIDPPGNAPLSFTVNGTDVVVEYVVHPGVPAQHFMRRSLERNTDTIENAIADALDERFSNLEDFN